MRDTVERLVETGLRDIGERYDEGAPEYLPYHNSAHTNDVMLAVTGIGRLAYINGKVQEADLSLLRLAACYHDYEHTSVEPGANERRSSEVAQERMRESGVCNAKKID